MRTGQTANWLRWNDAFPSGDSVGGTVALADRLLRLSTQVADRQTFLASALAEVATEFAAQWAAVRQRTPEWKTVGAWGRPAAEPISDSFLNEAQDRDAAGYLPPAGAAGVGALVVPLGPEGAGLLVLCGRTVAGDALPHLLAVARAIGHGLAVLKARSDQTERAERLKATLDIAGQFARTRETKPLLELIAAEACRLLGATTMVHMAVADGAGGLLHVHARLLPGVALSRGQRVAVAMDPDRAFVFPVAST